MENCKFLCSSEVHLEDGSYSLKEQVKHILKQIHLSKVPTILQDRREEASENLNLVQVLSKTHKKIKAM